jgi:hypothetical protein
MRTRPIYRLSTWLLVMGLVAACAELGLVAPQSFEEKLTAGLASVTAARETTTALLEAKKISSDDAQHIQDQLRNARAGLDIARAMGRTDPAAATAKVTAIHTGLVALQSYLAAREAAK